MNRTDTGRSVLAGLFHSSAEAEATLAELKSTGYPQAEISEVDKDASDDRTGDVEREPGRRTGREAAADVTPATTSASLADGSFFREHEAHASSFVDELLALNFSKNDAHHLVDSVVRGQALVTVDAGMRGTAGAREILERHGAKVHSAQGADAAGAAIPVAARPGSVPATDEASGERALELREERLQLEKRRVQHGEARLSKRVVTETQTIDVPVTHEELVIERTPGSGRAADGTIERNEEIVIPLSTEVVNVEKRVVATENVTIGKRQVEGVEHVNETVRKEELVVDDRTDTEAPKRER